MQIHKFTLLLGIFLYGCTLSLRKGPVPEPINQPPAPVVRSNIPESKETVAVWELLSPGTIQLQFKNVDDGTNLSVILKEGISMKPIPGGHWELTGFEKYGKSFYSMNISKKFILRKNQESNTYAGSMVLGCPRIVESDLKLIKDMAFFNRYPFSFTSGVCEIVIGNNITSVKSQLRKTQKSKRLDLVLGF